MGYSWTGISVGEVDLASILQELEDNLDLLNAELGIGVHSWINVPSIGGVSNNALGAEVRSVADTAEAQNTCSSHNNVLKSSHDNALLTGHDNALLTGHDNALQTLHDAADYGTNQTPYYESDYGSHKSPVLSGHNLSARAIHNSFRQSGYHGSH